MRAAAPTVNDLAAFAKPTPELAQNLSIVLRDLDDRGRAVEPDPRSPGGKGYTGLEALLQYVFNQTLAINTFGPFGHVLAVDAFVDPKCYAVRDAGDDRIEPAEVRVQLPAVLRLAGTEPAGRQRARPDQPAGLRARPGRSAAGRARSEHQRLPADRVGGRPGQRRGHSDRCPGRGRGRHGSGGRVRRSESAQAPVAARPAGS